MTTTIIQGDCRQVLKTLGSESVQTVVTSPPYFNLRQYLSNDDPNRAHEIGLEETPNEYDAKSIFIRR